MKNNFYKEDEELFEEDIFEEKFEEEMVVEQNIKPFWGETSGKAIELDVSNIKPEKKIKYRNDLIVFALPGDLVRVGSERLWLTKEVWKDVLGVEDVEKLLRGD